MSLNNKVLFFIGAGTEMVPGIIWAREMGLNVIATDQNPKAPGFQYANSYEVVSTRDIQGTLKAACKHNSFSGIDGVMTLACDVPLTVSTIAKHFNLPGLNYTTAGILQNKLHMKILLRDKGIPIPDFVSCNKLEDAIKISKKMGFPLVFKPIDSSGAKGVILVRNQNEVSDAFFWSLKYNISTDGILIEKFIPGLQISTESLVYQNLIFTTGFADRNYDNVARFWPYIIEDGHTIPSVLSQNEYQQVISMVERTIIALGINFGVGKGDLVMGPNGPVVIEFAGRLSGGCFSTYTVPLATGVNIVKQVIKLSVGEPLIDEDLSPKWNKGVAQRYFFPKPGKVVAIKGIDKLKDFQWVKAMEIYAQPGDCILPVTNHTQRSGYLITVGNDREEAVERAEWARKRILIETK